MGQNALHLNVTALSEPRLSALDEVVTGRYRNCSSTTTTPAFPIPWPLFKREVPVEPNQTE